MLKVIFDPDHEPGTPDGKAANLAYSFVKCYQEDKVSTVSVTTSSHVVVDAFRLQVVRGEIDHKNLTFEYKGETITIGKNARLSNYPRGFCDHMERNLSELLRFRGEFK